MYLSGKKLKKHLPEIIFGSADSNISHQISNLQKKGLIRKIAPRTYTSNLIDDETSIIRRNLFAIIGHLFPGAVLSHRSALEFKPTSSGQIFLTYKYTRKTVLGDLSIRFLKGKGPIDGDNPLSGELYASQRERALLENLQTTRKSGPDSKTLPHEEIEKRLEEIIRVHGEPGLNKLRDRAREISVELGYTREFAKLNKIISALLSSRPSDILTSPTAVARAFGVPFDAKRIELFETLFRELSQREFAFRKEQNISERAFRNFAFFESYFSNYIEGTVFGIDEARGVIESQVPLPARNEDSYDILGTYQLIANRTEMSITPDSSEELINILQRRHKILLSARTSKKPGEFKDRDNFAGQTAFVAKELVRGTLIKGFDYYRALSHPFAKAAYIMFLISEVHPFLDGNGRIARVMMNAELVAANQSKIIIPTVYREDYLLSLRKLTRRSQPDAFIRMLDQAHQFSAKIVSGDFEEMQRLLEARNAFLEDTEGYLRVE